MLAHGRILGELNLAGSFHSLVAFGRNVLDWNGGAECLVPGTLDGVSVTFAFLAWCPASDNSRLHGLEICRGARWRRGYSGARTTINPGWAGCH